MGPTCKHCTKPIMVSAVADRGWVHAEIADRTGKHQAEPTAEWVSQRADFMARNFGPTVPRAAIEEAIRTYGDNASACQVCGGLGWLDDSNILCPACKGTGTS